MAFLRTILEDPPPLVPEAALRAARATYDQFLRILPSSATEVEDALIMYGRILWPYRKAFAVLVRESMERADAHATFTVELPPTLRAQFTAFARAGGTLTDLHDPDATRARESFSPREIGVFCPALVAARQRADGFVRASIATDATGYRKHIHEFQAIQHELEQHIAALRRLADRTADHPEIAAEIRETVRGFERGLAQLAREPEVQEVCAAIEGYRARDAERRGVRRSEAREQIFGSR